MKYLDERITFYLDAQAAELGYVPKEGVDKFEIYRYNAFNSSSNYKELVFVGNLYHDGGTDEHIDITDIVRSLKEVPDSETIKNVINYNWATVITLQDRFKVIWYTQYYNNVVTPLESEWETVSMIYRYPNYRNNFSDGSNVFFDTFETSGGMRTSLQGLNSYVTSHHITRYRYLLPAHYPLRATNNYKFIQSFIAQNDIETLSIDVEGASSEQSYNFFSFNTSPFKKGTLLVTTISNLIGANNVSDTFTEDLDIYDNYSRKIGVLDCCYKRYYLMWQDRFGGFQSQAFNDYATYSESFTTTESQNYRSERKKVDIQVQPKWKINSGWITEELFPIYESIYVSPILYLYDSNEDRLFEVMVKGDYVEKTHKSEKKLLNLNLELELNSKQNIIY